jgi:small-conductance mechanosensitive channel
VNVAGITGTVVNLSIRSTTLRTSDDVIVVVPNQSILTTALRNYTKESSLVRIMSRTTVLHDGDPKDVEKVLIEAAYGTPGVLRNPAATVLYAPFVKGKVTADLAAWIDRPSAMERVTSDLNLSVRDTLLAKGFEIA